MIWTKQHNDMHIREMYLFDLWKYKKGSPQRGNVSEQISALNDLDDHKFDVTQKSIRDHYNLLENQKKRLKDEEKASGTSPVHSDFEDAMENIIQLLTGKHEEDQEMILRRTKNMMLMQQKY